MIFWLLLGTILVIAALAFLEYLMQNADFEKIPGPKETFLVQHALDFLGNPVYLFYYVRKLTSEFKKIFKLKIVVMNVVIMHDPEDVEVILSSNTKNTSKGFLYQFLAPWLQQGLLLSDGKKWVQRRKILTPTFHFNILRHFHTILEENSWKLVKQLESEAGKDKTDVTSFISEFTLNSICETAMGITLNEEANDFGKRYKNGIFELGRLFVYRSQKIWMYPKWIFDLTAAGRKQKKVISVLGAFRDKVIDRRRANPDYESMIPEMDSASEGEDPGVNLYKKKKMAMLDLLLQSEKQGTIDAKGIGEEVDTFMFEGHDTTATALQFLFMSLACYPEIQEKARKELDEIFGDSDRSATMTDLSQMKYLEACIKETMRLYPSVPIIMRSISHDTKLKNYTIPAGTECTILVFDLQRRTDQFVEPLHFKPERFQVEPTWHPYAYVPFSAGPRNCIGQKFAMMEMKLAASAVLRHYKMLPVTRSEDVIFAIDFILRTDHPIYVKFVKRD